MKSAASARPWNAGPPLAQNLNGTQSETEHAELLLADLVGQEITVPVHLIYE
jgi:hypothetical protein